MGTHARYRCGRGAGGVAARPHADGWGDRAARGRRAVERRRERRPRRLVLRQHGPVSVPGAGMLVHRRVHDGRASRPRVAGARRPEPASSCGPGERGRAQPARRDVRAVLRAERVVLRVGSGGSPGARHPRQVARCRGMLRDIGWVARRQGVNGLHVHVGIESADACYERLESVLPWLPVVLALSANSPFFDGVETGMLSSRASILAELPRAGAPPAFGSYAGWEAWVERLTRIGVIEDNTRVWWDVRPHPRFGTLEVRIADQPTALERTALTAEPVVALVAAAPTTVTPRGDYLQNRWAAAQNGLDAELIHPNGERVVGARELAAELLGREPTEPEAMRQLE